MSRVFQNMARIARNAGDRHFCGPVAMAIATKSPYRTTARAFFEAGRKRGAPSYGRMYMEVGRELGFRVQPASDLMRGYLDEIEEVYGNEHKTLTPGMVKRYPRISWANQGRRELWCVKDHIMAMVNGRVHDWAAPTRKHVIMIYRVVPK